MKTKIKICSRCKSEKTIKSLHFNGKRYSHWYRDNGKVICRRCWEKKSLEFNKAHRKAQKKHITNHKDREYARRIGNKLRLDYCEKCNIKGVKLEAHHWDYSFPKHIITLCIKCHNEVHKKQS